MVDDQALLSWVRRAVEQGAGRDSRDFTPTEREMIALRQRIATGDAWYEEALQGDRDARFWKGYFLLKELRQRYYDLIKACPHSRLVLYRTATANGVAQVYLSCFACERNPRGVSGYVPHELLRRFGLDPLSVPFPPGVGEPEYETCVHCQEQKPGEWHHFAPRRRFREPERWPVAYLCRDCHQRWHDVMGWGNEPWAKTEEQVEREQRAAGGTR